MARLQDVDPHWYARFPIESAEEWADTHFAYIPLRSTAAPLYRPLIGAAIVLTWSLYFAHGAFFLLLADPLELDPWQCAAAGAIVLGLFIWVHLRKSRKAPPSLPITPAAPMTTELDALNEANENTTLIWHRYTQFLHEYDAKSASLTSSFAKPPSSDQPKERMPTGTIRPSFFRHEVKTDDPKERS